jgi:hypothetical protein
MVNQIDSIFSKVKKPVSKADATERNPKVASKVPANESKETKTPIKSNKTKREGTSSDPFALQAKVKDTSMDFTEEGWRVYTPEELKIGKGGDTDLCPFDCNCCF